ncbi:MAG: 16S rRNA (uracil(1498)-N(3))-methyltransferase [Deltaproteobacteria bacterium]|nr:16S rRNA (uracil(1498)-N(3))-methyltransferase [Deltaproteobacteria bacterium]
MAEKPIIPIRRLGIESLTQSTGVLVLPESTVHHFRVLRLGVGSKVRLLDGRGYRADGVVLSTRKNAVVCELTSVKYTPRPARRVVLVQAVPKGSKLEIVVRMTAELGVHAIYLAASERSVPRVKRERSFEKTERLRRIAQEACVQSDQPYCPEVREPAYLLEAAGGAPEEAIRLVFWEHSTEELDSVLSRFTRPASRTNKDEEVWAVVGPEGGFSTTEIESLHRLGYRDIGLGPSLMRVETAAPLIVGLILDRLGRFGFEYPPEQLPFL